MSLKQEIYGDLRFTIIRKGVIRIEYACSGAFLDESTLFAVNREWDGAEVQITRNENELCIKSESYTLHCLDSAKEGIKKENLYVELHPEGEVTDIWFLGKKNRGNLGGTLATLDGVRGTTPIPEGLISRDGWQIINDSNKPYFSNDWIAGRSDEHRLDLYLFVYGTDYKGALKDLAYVSGAMKLPRRCVFGSWYSRWWPYTDKEFLEIVDEYQNNDFPLDILVMDMDWHYNDWTFEEGDENHPNRALFGKGHAHNLGWTGYTWNRKLIPDPKKLLEELHKREILVTLNDHPGDSVRPNEECYDEFVKLLGHEPVYEGDPLLKAADKDYMEAFMESSHRSIERQGVAFWWLDWQQRSEVAGVKNLHHLPWLNHLYYESSRKGGKRGISFSRWGGYGDQRHPIYFSGDVKAKWEALKYEVAFTATAANCGCFYWSHDTGAFFGERNPEMYIRWVQFCITTATLRLHSQRDALLDRCPWKWGEKEGAIMRDMFHLRSRLIPYIYSTAKISERESLPFIKPMYYDFPDEEFAYAFKEQYYLGHYFLCAPVTQPIDKQSETAEKYVWIPKGCYYNFFTGEKMQSNTRVETFSALDTFPLYVKGGCPVPMQPYTQRMTARTPEAIIVKVFPSDEDCKNTFNLYDDDGITDNYLKGECLNTAISYEKSGEEITLSIIPDKGYFATCPKKRQYTIELEQTEELRILEATVKCENTFNQEEKRNVISFESVEIHSPLFVKLK